MSLGFKSLAIALLVVGLGFGVSFGAGVAYGRGTPKEVQSGLTQQQIQALLGLGGGAAAAAASGAGGAGASGTTGGASGTAAAAAAARSTMGTITAVPRQTITIETRTGPQKVTLASGATISRLQSGGIGDLRAGLAITASGTRKDDGSFEATAINQVPVELISTLGGATGGATGSPAGGAGGARGTPTPSAGR